MTWILGEIAVGEQDVGVKVGVGLEPLPGGTTSRSISFGWRLTVKVEPVAWDVPAIEAILEGEGFTFPLIWRPEASCGAPVEEEPEGSMTHAFPEEAGLNPDIEMFAVWLLVGWLLAMKRVRLPEASVAA